MPAKCPKGGTTHVVERKARFTNDVHKCKNVNCVKERYRCKTCKLEFDVYTCQTK